MELIVEQGNKILWFFRFVKYPVCISNSQNEKQHFKIMPPSLYHTGLIMSYKPEREAVSGFIKPHLTLKPSSGKSCRSKYSKIIWLKIKSDGGIKNWMQKISTLKFVRLYENSQHCFSYS